MIGTLFIFLIILAILIFAHELGHFLAAKKAGVRVDEFGFGFPPRLFSLKKGETVYSINLIPFGGFVKIYGEQGEGKNEQNSFISKSVGQRAIIITAGVAMNFLLAVLLLSVGHMTGLPTVIDENEIGGGIVKNQKIQITDVARNSPAEKIGLKIGDEIRKLKIKSENGKAIDVKKAEDVTNFISGHKGQEVILEIQRGKEILDISLVPRENPPEGEGPIGIALADTAIISYPWWKSLYKGAEDVVNIIILVTVVLAGIIYKAIVGQPVGEVLTGPIGIYTITSQAAGLGFIYLLQLTAFLSIQLGLINIFPFPALDGGRLLFLGIEKIKGAPVSQKVENIIHTAGFALLIALMIFITYKDIVKFF